MQGIYTRFCKQNCILLISGLAVNNVVRKTIVKTKNHRICYTIVAFRRSDEGITTDPSNNLGKGDVHIRVFGNEQTLSWTSGEAICAVYIYEKDNYQKTRGQNSKF